MRIAYSRQLGDAERSDKSADCRGPTHISQNGAIAEFCLTLGIYEVFLERSGRKIWVKPEPRAEPYIPSYTRVRSDSDESAASP